MPPPTSETPAAQGRIERRAAQREDGAAEEKEERRTEWGHLSLKRRRRSQEGAHVAWRAPFAMAREFTVGDGGVRKESKHRWKSQDDEWSLLDVDSLFGYERKGPMRNTDGCYRRESFGGVIKNAQRRERKDGSMLNNLDTPKERCCQKESHLGEKGGHDGEYVEETG